MQINCIPTHHKQTQVPRRFSTKLVKPILKLPWRSKGPRLLRHWHKWDNFPYLTSKITTTVINQFDIVTGIIKSTNKLVQGTQKHSHVSMETWYLGELVFEITGVKGSLTHGVGTSDFFSWLKKKFLHQTMSKWVNK